MIFDVSRAYYALNADGLGKGDLVFVSHSATMLRTIVSKNGVTAGGRKAHRVEYTMEGGDACIHVHDTTDVYEHAYLICRADDCYATILEDWLNGKAFAEYQEPNGQWYSLTEYSVGKALEKGCPLRYKEE